MVVMHKDVLGNEIKENCIIAYPSHNRLKIGTVRKCTPKMVSVVPVGKQYWDRKYPYEVLVVDDPKISLYILKNSK